MDNGRCRLHGGKTPKGIAAGSFKHGRHSKDLPARLAQSYQEALQDPNLMALRDDIALIETRLYDLLKRVDSGESGKLWRDSQSAYKDLVKALRAQDTKEINNALFELDLLLQKGVSDYAAWDEVSKTLEQRKRLIESERKRLVESQQMITNDRLMVLIAAITDTIRRHVPDRGTLVSISGDISRLLAAQNTSNDEEIENGEYQES